MTYHGRGPRRVDRPIAGRDLYVTPAEYHVYAETVIATWGEVAAALPT